MVPTAHRHCASDWSHRKEFAIVHTKNLIWLYSRGKGSGSGQQRLTAGQRRHECIRALGVEFRKDVVKEENRARPRNGSDQFMRGKTQGEGQRSLLSLGRMGAGWESTDRERDVIAMGSHGGDLAPKILVATSDQRFTEPESEPIRIVVDLNGHWCPGNGGICSVQDGADLIDECHPARGDGVSQWGELTVPNIESGFDLRGTSASGLTEQRVSLTQHAFEVTEGLVHRRVEGHERVVEEGPTNGWTPFDEFEVIGSENTDAEVTQKISRPLQALTVDLHPATPGTRNLGFDQQRSLFSLAFGTDDGRCGTLSDECFRRNGTEGPKGGEVTHGLEKAGFSLAVVPDDGRKTIGQSEFRLVVAAEFLQPELVEMHL